jgi:hypothetical protein
MCSGNAVHFHKNYDASGVPSFNFDWAQTLASINRYEQANPANAKTTVIIQYDACDVDKLLAFPVMVKYLAIVAEPSRSPRILAVERPRQARKHRGAPRSARRSRSVSPRSDGNTNAKAVLRQEMHPQIYPANAKVCKGNIMRSSLRCPAQANVGLPADRRQVALRWPSQGRRMMTTHH